MEGELLSDYFQEGKQLTGAVKPAWVGFTTTNSLACAAISRIRPNSRIERRLAVEGIHSICVLPMALQGKCIGTLSFVSRERDRYSKQDALFLQEVANQVVLAIQNMQSYREIASLKARLEKENIYLREELRAEHNFEEIVGNSPALLKVLRDVEQVAPTDSTVLIYGETGTGRKTRGARNS